MKSQSKVIVLVLIALISLALPFESLASTELPPSTISRLTQIANQMSYIWGDSILEGDYYSDAPTVLEKIEILRNQDQTIAGYRITYSAQAVDTFENKSGKIIERAYVSADFQDFYQDEQFAAEFFENR